MSEKKPMVQSTIRLDAEMLREAQYYFSLERTNVTKFVTEKMQEFIQAYRKAHPERVPGGVRETD
jgi:hypothetical protein